MHDLAVLNGSVWSGGEYRRTNLYVENGRFAALTPDVYPAKKTLDAANRLVLPGFIDPHVHFALNVGKATSADDFLSGSRTAAHGGVTTFIDFLDPVDNAADLEKAFAKRKEEARYSAVDYKFHATLKNPAGHVEELVAKVEELGITSVKIFTTYSDSGRRTYDPEIRELLKWSDRKGFLLEVHAEADDLIVQDPFRSHRFLPQSRPVESEVAEALKLAGYVRELGGNLLMVHVSSGSTLEQLRLRFPDVLNRRFHVESCPQYLLLDEGRLAGNQGFLYTCAPPLRSPDERDLLTSLWDKIEVIGTDHCPFRSEEKDKRFLAEIPLGISGVEHAFSLLYRRFGDSVLPKMTTNPSLLHRLSDRKGKIEAGYDADFVVFRPDPFAKIEGNHSRCDYDPWTGEESGGKIEATVSRGKLVVQNGRFIQGDGHFLGGCRP